MPVSFANLRVGMEYTRPQLAKLWGYQGYEALSTGTVTPANTPYIILFITKEKQEFLTQYEDAFEDGILEMEGQKSHKTDRRFIEAEASSDEIHLFYRERHHAPFIYQGRVYLTDYEIRADRPSKFRLATDATIAQVDSAIETEEETHGIPDANFFPDEEGRRRIIQHVTYERSRKNRARALQIHGKVCKACGFDFNETYGPIHAKDYIEVHHVRSISSQEGKPIDPTTDLIPLCSNCHSMAHRRRGQILSLGEIRNLLFR
jgi:5-methylcytosine-specific restriction protein A